MYVTETIIDIAVNLLFALYIYNSLVGKSNAKCCCTVDCILCHECHFYNQCTSESSSSGWKILMTTICVIVCVREKECVFYFWVGGTTD